MSHSDSLTNMQSTSTAHTESTDDKEERKRNGNMQLEATSAMLVFKQAIEQQFLNLQLLVKFI